jgi:uncharacterized protein (DUF1684 family)
MARAHARGSHAVRPGALSLALVMLLASCARPPEPIPVDPVAYTAAVEAWYARRLAQLQAPDSWLSLIGLDWLQQGATTIGAAPDNGIVLPAGKAPDHVGRIVVSGDSVRFVADSGVTVTRGIDSTLALPAGSAVLPPDPSEEPLVTQAELSRDLGPGKSVVVRLGSLNWMAIRRGDRVALRVRDDSSQEYQVFPGIERYPVSTAWRITARWVPHRKKVAVSNEVGMVTEEESPARLEFWIGGLKHTLDVVGPPEDGRYMLVFGDATNGTETYGGGRFLWIDPPDARNRVVLDFNLAYNPPCVWTPYATCPLPTKDNRLGIAVEAGEKAPRH